jgi:DNA processing protein
MARGIDGAAHRGALSAGGGTVGVLGTGIDVVYPSSNRDLFQSMRRTGLLVSEFLPSEKGLPHHFPKRNRIIAALSRAVIVVEAGHRSGALITVEHALDLGREIFAVPGSVENKRALESNRLLRDGAQVLTEPRTAFESMKHLFPEVSPTQGELQLAGRESASDQVPEEFRTIFSAVRQEPRSLSGVAEDAGVETDQALAALSTLELEGWVIQLPGMRFRRP